MLQNVHNSTKRECTHVHNLLVNILLPRSDDIRDAVVRYLHLHPV
jgi:hypothetical protein